MAWYSDNFGKGKEIIWITDISYLSTAFKDIIICSLKLNKFFKNCKVNAFI